MKSVQTAFRCSWQNGVCERWIGSLKRELLDHVIISNESHARRLIGEYVDYYHNDRCHLSLGKDTPEHRPIQHKPPGEAEVVALSRVGGIHHRYEWTKAA
jgi:putative transposase